MAMRSPGGASKTLRMPAHKLGCHRIAVFKAGGTSPVRLNCLKKNPTCGKLRNEPVPGKRGVNGPRMKTSTTKLLQARWGSSQQASYLTSLVTGSAKPFRRWLDARSAGFPVPGERSWSDPVPLRFLASFWPLRSDKRMTTRSSKSLIWTENLALTNVAGKGWLVTSKSCDTTNCQRRIETHAAYD